MRKAILVGLGLVLALVINAPATRNVVDWGMPTSVVQVP